MSNIKYIEELAYKIGKASVENKWIIAKVKLTAPIEAKKAFERGQMAAELQKKLKESFS